MTQACAATGSLAVAIWMHFTLDLVSFCICHFEVTSADESEQLRLVNAESPVASMLRSAFRPAVQGPSPSQAAE